MQRNSFPAAGAVLINLAALFAVHDANAEPPDTGAYETIVLRGRAVWLEDALRRQHNLELDADAHKTTIVLVTADGALHPLVKDIRGRAFSLDPRLHALEWELTVRRWPRSPWVQVVRTVTRDEQGHRYEFDYWCDVCAIPMVHLKECECCQGPIRMRQRRVDAPEIER